VYSQYIVIRDIADLSLHNRIAVFRAERGISRRQLAEAIGVNNQTIGYLERGDYKPSLELALKIARHFGVAVEMLFSLERFEPIAMTLRRAGDDK
jgi:DNA-binding XRE family transcriptional regulator